MTLSEAYQFAFRDTLARTERSRGGPQHPSWDIQLAGSGDVVLTDLHGMTASLLFPADSSGRFFVRDADERLVAELRKEPGQPVTLGLDPGAYHVSHELAGQLVETEVEVEAGPPTLLPASGFTPVPRQLTVLRGDVPERLEQRFVDVALFPPVSLNGNRPAVNHMQLALVASRTTRLLGVGLGPCCGGRGRAGRDAGQRGQLGRWRVHRHPAVRCRQHVRRAARAPALLGVQPGPRRGARPPVLRGRELGDRQCHRPAVRARQPHRMGSSVRRSAS